MPYRFYQALKFPFEQYNEEYFLMSITKRAASRMKLKQEKMPHNSYY